jgi:hypothetical protein
MLSHLINYRSIVAMRMNVMRRNDVDAGQMPVTKKNKSDNSKINQLLN